MQQVEIYFVHVLKLTTVFFFCLNIDQNVNPFFSVC